MTALVVARRMPAIVAAVALSLFAWPVVAADPLAGIARVIEADTIELLGIHIRLVGIDAPESRQTCRQGGTPWPCGQAAAFALADHIERKIVTCRGDEFDPSAQILAVCWLGSENLNSWLVREGWALADRQYSTVYVPEENSARIARRGIWASAFVAPWDWRRAH